MSETTTQQPTSGTLTIWCNAKLPEASLARLRAGVAPHRLVISGQKAYNLEAGGVDPSLAGADVAFGQPDPQQIASSQRLRWIHITSAGYTRYDTDACRTALRARGAAFTNSSSVYDEPCSQHAFAMMLALSRQLPAALDAQRADRGWDQIAIRERSYLLAAQSVVLLGFGAIARRLSEMLAPFRMNVVAVRRTIRGDEPVRTVTTDQTNAVLPDADHVISTMPSAAGNERFMNAERFGLMKPSAVFYNVGRGDTVDQAALLSALQQKRIAAAYLDVTDPEPLPPDHPLWSAPNCHITPHTAGGRQDEFDALVDHFLENLRRFTSSNPLRDRIV